MNSRITRGKHLAAGHTKLRGIDIKERRFFKIFHGNFLLLPRKPRLLPGHEKQNQQLDKLQIPRVDPLFGKWIQIDIADLDMVDSFPRKVFKAVCASRLQADRLSPPEEARIPSEPGALAAPFPSRRPCG